MAAKHSSQQGHNPLLVPVSQAAHLPQHADYTQQWRATQLGTEVVVPQLSAALANTAHG
jgi:hypothetical protein